MTGPAAPRPGISVVLPVRDDAPALRSCLAALARQDRPADEIVVVDNGSSDDLLAVIAAAERDQDLPLRLLQEPRPGVSFAAHAGYDAASHQIIARCDADSIPPSSWLARIERQLAAEDDKLVAITGGGRFAPGPRAGPIAVRPLPGALPPRLRTGPGPPPAVGLQHGHAHLMVEPGQPTTRSAPGHP